VLSFAINDDPAIGPKVAGPCLNVHSVAVHMCPGVVVVVADHFVSVVSVVRFHDQNITPPDYPVKLIRPNYSVEYSFGQNQQNRPAKTGDTSAAPLGDRGSVDPWDILHIRYLPEPCASDDRQRDEKRQHEQANGCRASR